MTQGLIPTALVSAALAATLAAWEAFAPHGHVAGEQTHGHEDSLGEYLVVLGIVGVAAAVVFGWVVRRGLHRKPAPWTALALSILGLLSIAAFWSGVPPVLAGGGILLGWVSRDASRGRWAALAAIAIGGFALAADVALYVGGMS